MVRVGISEAGETDVTRTFAGGRGRPCDECEREREGSLPRASAQSCGNMDSDRDAKYKSSALAIEEQFAIIRYIKVIRYSGLLPVR
jgi:hypothetical protein